MLNGMKYLLSKDPTLKELRKLLNQEGLNLSLLLHGKKINLLFLFFFVSQVLLALCLMIYLL